MSSDTIQSLAAATLRRALDSDENGVCRICGAEPAWKCDEVAHRLAKQPMPTPNAQPAIVDLAITDLKDRDLIGVRTYGSRLQAHNGRDALRDAYEEALDLSLYLRQCIEERKALHLTDAERAALRWLLYLSLPVKNEQERQHSIAAMTAIARLIGEGQ